MENQVTVTTTKKWYQSRTVQFAILTGALGIVTALESVYPTAGILVTLASLINVVLRFGVTQPIQ